MLKCPACGKEYKRFAYLCSCGSVLLWAGRGSWSPSGRGIWRYSGMLPAIKSRVSLGEGDTPLVRTRDFPREYPNLYYKFEGDNPTGSFKDRGTSVVLSHAQDSGFKKVGVASTGNMGASVSAYSAYANLDAEVFVPVNTPANKITQIIAYGAGIKKVRGSYSNSVSELMKRKRDYYLAMTGLNPYYIEGAKTISFEIFEDVGVPDKIVVPVGSGGLLTGVWKGFRELQSMGVSSKVPQVIGVQSSVCAPIALSWKKGSKEFDSPCSSEGIASAILVKEPFNGLTAVDAVRESEGFFTTVTDSQVLDAMPVLAGEGLMAEPASAAAFAGFLKEFKSTKEKVVVLLTGHGLKQPSAFLRVKRKR